MKKKIILGALGLLLLASCGENSTAYKSLKSQYDSVAVVNQNYENDLHEMDSLVASVLTNFQDMASVENMINANPMRGDVSMDEKQRIKDNVTLINEKLRASGEALESLTKKLESSGKDNKRLKNTLAALKRELEQQSARVLSLTEELERKNYAIGVLDNTITNLHGDIERLNQDNTRQASTLSAQERELNTVRYCIGTRKDLKDYNLVKSGRVVTENANLDYFRTADLRKLTQIPLDSDDAKLLTVHNSKSYELIPDSQGNLTLNIKDPQLFWANSKILVVQVD